MNFTNHRLTDLAVSINWGGLFLGVLRIRALLFWIYIRAPDFWKLPFVVQKLVD